MDPGGAIIYLLVSPCARGRKSSSHPSFIHATNHFRCINLDNDSAGALHLDFRNLSESLSSIGSVKQQIASPSNRTICDMLALRSLSGVRILGNRETKTPRGRDWRWRVRRMDRPLPLAPRRQGYSGRRLGTG